MGDRAGDSVEVDLDLFNTSTISIGGATWPVQLLLGTAVTDEGDLSRLMASRREDGRSDGGDRRMHDGIRQFMFPF